jgi:hypothetical protein
MLAQGPAFPSSLGRGMVMTSRRVLCWDKCSTPLHYGIHPGVKLYLVSSSLLLFRFSLDMRCYSGHLVLS